MPFGDRAELALFRCPDRARLGCAIDGLPGPEIVAAGADRRYVVVEQRSGSVTRFFYFARVKEEKHGWGRNPEQIKGPLTPEEFRLAAARLRLPELSIRP